jgi:hypothetical protein
MLLFYTYVIIVSKVGEARNDGDGTRQGPDQECGEEA